MIDDNLDSKYIQVDRLIELLNMLEPDDRSYPNRLRNLTVADKNGTYKGFIDFLLRGEIEVSQSLDLLP